MPKPTKGPRLGGGPAHERLMLANLAASLFEHKSIKTTETKAKRLRPVAERLVTFAKRGDLHSRRRVMQTLRNNKEAAHILFTEIAPLVENREGGYTRITKLGFRKGDNASMVSDRARPRAREPQGQELEDHRRRRLRSPSPPTSHRGPRRRDRDGRESGSRRDRDRDGCRRRGRSRRRCEVGRRSSK